MPVQAVGFFDRAALCICVFALISCRMCCSDYWVNFSLPFSLYIYSNFFITFLFRIFIISNKEKKLTCPCGSFFFSFTWLFLFWLNYVIFLYIMIHVSESKFFFIVFRIFFSLVLLYYQPLYIAILIITKDIVVGNVYVCWFSRQHGSFTSKLDLHLIIDV